MNSSDIRIEEKLSLAESKEAVIGKIEDIVITMFGAPPSPGHSSCRNDVINLCVSVKNVTVK